MSQSPIFNARSRPLNELSGSLPDVSGALFDYFQEMTFGQVIKTVVNFQVVETAINTIFQGMIQPFTAQQLAMKPEGQRLWTWYRVYSQINLALVPDDVITYLGVQYRVMNKTNYSLYQYYEYDLIQDYTGSGPST